MLKILVPVLLEHITKPSLNSVQPKAGKALHLGLWHPACPSVPPRTHDMFCWLVWWKCTEGCCSQNFCSTCCRRWKMNNEWGRRFRNQGGWFTVCIKASEYHLTLLPVPQKSFPWLSQRIPGCSHSLQAKLETSQLPPKPVEVIDENEQIYGLNEWHFRLHFQNGPADFIHLLMRRDGVSSSQVFCKSCHAQSSYKGALQDTESQGQRTIQVGGTAGGHSDHPSSPPELHWRVTLSLPHSLVSLPHIVQMQQRTWCKSPLY